MEITIPSKTIEVSIFSVYHNEGNWVTVELTEDGTNPAPNLRVVISGDNYTELMSANPPWSPNKPANVFRNEDLWHFIQQGI